MHKTKTCIACGKDKPLSEFSKDERHKDKGTSKCKVCINKYQGQRYKDGHGYKKGGFHLKTNANRNNTRLKYRFGITASDYQNILLAQNGVCAICGKKETAKGQQLLGVDHNHKTKKVRGLLCHKCNVILGLCHENIDTLTSAIAYLRREGIAII